MKSSLKSRQKSRRNFRKKTKYGGQRKYTYAHKKRRRTRSRRRTNIREHKTIKQHGGANWYGCILKDTYPNIYYLPDADGDKQTKRDFLKNLQKEKGRIHLSKSICKRNDGYPPNKFKNLQSCVHKALEDPNICFPTPPAQRQRRSMTERIAEYRAKKRKENPLGTINDPIIDDDL